MKIKCDKCGKIVEYTYEDIENIVCKRPRRANDLTNIALDNLVLGHGYFMVGFVNCDCGNKICLGEVANDRN